MTYEQALPISRGDAEAALAASEERAAEAMIRVSLNESDREWAEAFCLAGLRDDRCTVRAAAITGLGHLARRYQAASRAVISTLQSLRADPALGGTAEDALDDILSFADEPGIQ